ncbi:S25 ribosomal protein-domain-containing protein [Endogone sp. FLAS-F59071]|nr:S25 ribosomal protein-domain-containing protein [Endogone sp. FLAS-F59071]|eukprot:RUS23168.1 S25 ribosomal protein-domain-containing protein [Endogone sp. FLAS-F59071]
MEKEWMDGYLEAIWGFGMGMDRLEDVGGWMVVVKGMLDRQKWSAKKVKDKANNLVILDKPTYDRLFKEVPSYKLVTPSILVDRLRLNGSLARLAIRELEAKGLIRKITSHSSQMIYSTYLFIAGIDVVFDCLLGRVAWLFFECARATGYVEPVATEETDKAPKVKAPKVKKPKATAEEEAPAEEEE